VIRLFAALAIFMASPTDDPAPIQIPPSINLSAIRYIYCTKGDSGYTGSAFLIGDHELATARHVAHGDKCYDVATHTQVKMFYEDTRHDFALMVAPSLPTNIPYLRYRCDGIKAGHPYMSYGVTDFQQDVPILRENTIRATKDIIKEDDAVDEFPHSKGMRLFDGAIAPGMSGGPVTDIDGYVVAVNNAGDGHQTLLFDIKDSALCKK
jgi:hypothetical protein